MAKKKTTEGASATTQTQPAYSFGAASAKPQKVSHDLIAKRAYELYLARGGVNGSAEDDWRKAERELMAKMR